MLFAKCVGIFCRFFLIKENKIYQLICVINPVFGKLVIYLVIYLVLSCSFILGFLLIVKFLVTFLVPNINPVRLSPLSHY